MDMFKVFLNTNVVSFLEKQIALAIGIFSRIQLRFRKYQYMPMCCDKY